MRSPIVSFQEPITLLGGGEVHAAQLRAILERAPRLVAADGGANMAAAEGLVPDWVIGDFDSVSADALALVPVERHVKIDEQETTDFEKCLINVNAPLIFGLGFMGLRADHTLAALNALVRHPDRACILLDRSDLVLAAPRALSLDLAQDTRLSLFPMGRVTGRSDGLLWPIDGIGFAPDGRIGTSNQVCGPVRLSFDQPGMLITLPIETLDAVVRALRQATGWQVPSGRQSVRGE